MILGKSAVIWWQHLPAGGEGRQKAEGGKELAGTGGSCPILPVGGGNTRKEGPFWPIQPLELP
ncbi:hypothetical protein A3860_03905 [Niastella vici]|uniref:Uncharacterized protein n=1 Tax=Niastella vici TaxID=1703345 RepID=A0A1V9FRB9_9BACT|nr:hypothetical protein A3860_03905 [Niastella vici]